MSEKIIKIINYENVNKILCDKVKFQREKCLGDCQFTYFDDLTGFVNTRYYTECTFFDKQTENKIIDRKNKDFHDLKLVVYRCQECKDTFKAYNLEKNYKG